MLIHDSFSSSFYYLIIYLFYVYFRKRHKEKKWLFYFFILHVLFNNNHFLYLQFKNEIKKGFTHLYKTNEIIYDTICAFLYFCFTEAKKTQPGVTSLRVQLFLVDFRVAASCFLFSLRVDAPQLRRANSVITWQWFESFCCVDNFLTEFSSFTHFTCFTSQLWTRSVRRKHAVFSEQWRFYLRLLLWGWR